MDALLFVLVLFLIFVGGGWIVGRGIGGLLGSLFGAEEKPTFIDKSVHYHFHTHDTGPKTIKNDTHHHTHQHLTIIDEETHQKGVDHFSNKKESRDE
jgi:hypothetical protein